MSVPKKPTSAPVPLPSSKRGFKGFFRETMRELKHVHWPKKEEVSRLTGVVLVICLLTVAYLFLVAQGFNTLFTAIFRGGQ